MVAEQMCKFVTFFTLGFVRRDLLIVYALAQKRHTSGIDQFVME